MLTIGSCFAGIGGWELGLESELGCKTLWQIEQNEYCQKVLEKHWPEAIRHGDIKSVGAAALEPVDIICGGFPCQDISCAGSGKGLAGERSGLWWEMHRIISTLRPTFVLIENTPLITRRGGRDVVGALAESGYTCVWDIVSAAAIGAPQLRERFVCVSYADGEQLRDLRRRWRGSSRPRAPVAANDGTLRSVADTNSRGCEVERLSEYREQQSPSGREPDRRSQGRRGHREDVPDTSSEGLAQREGAQAPPWTRASVARSDWWATEPRLGRVAPGVPNRTHRLKAIGNSIVPAVAAVAARYVRQMLENDD